MSLDMLTLWQKRARPAPGPRDLDVAIGVHLEEVAEMMDSLTGVGQPADMMLADAMISLTRLADALKSGEIRVHVGNRRGLLDALADQVVTTTGVAHCAQMNLNEAVHQVNSSNWSKFVDGLPVFDVNGKVTKGPKYQPPNLDGLY